MAQNTTSSSKRPQIAVVANIYQTHLHTQHIIDRILEGYGWGGVFYHSPLEVVSLFVEQRGEGDLVPDRTRRQPRKAPSRDHTNTAGPRRYQRRAESPANPHHLVRLDAWHVPGRA